MMDSISEFYAGRSIFITGATGFMGKVLVEKILRSCPTVKALYLMVRPKKGQAPEERVEGLFKSKLFEQLSQEQPDFRCKVFAMRGDILEPDLGLSETNIDTIINEVSIVFHSAATVKFDEQLKLSIQMNVLGVKELLSIAHKMKKLDSFVHVSTAYANCDRDEVLETVYAPSIDPHKILDSVDWMSVNMFETLTPTMVEPRPNTYTFTKSMAEYLVLQDSKALPMAIVRPSIVGASWREPVAGWVDNFNGPTGLFAAIGKGLLRTMHGNFHGTADIIPVDIATNLMLAVAWSTAMERSGKLKVYNCTTGQLNKVTWGQIERASEAYFIKNPLYEIIRIPDPRFTSSMIWRHLNKFFDHHLPAWIIDLGLKVTGKKPIMSRLQTRLWKSVSCLEYFTSKEWKFSNDNVLALLERLNQSDRKEFNFDVREIHWPTYLENYLMGTKQYVLKEELSNVTEARRRLKRMQRRNQIVKVIVFLVGMRFLITRVAVVRNLWQFLLSWILRIVQKLPAITKS